MKQNSNVMKLLKLGHVIVSFEESQSPHSEEIVGKGNYRCLLCEILKLGFCEGSDASPYFESEIIKK